MSSPTWSVYDGAWADMPASGFGVSSTSTLRGCGLRRRALLQRGAQGAVYLAEDGAGVLYAVKRLYTLRGDFGPRGVSEAALREAALLARLSAPSDAVGVVRLHRVLEAPHGELCLVLDYCPLDLARLALRRGRRPAERCPRLDAPHVVRWLLRHVLRTLRFLHEDCRVLHRDVKLSNILVRSDGGLRLSDFGSARLMHSGVRDAQTGAMETDAEYTPAALRTTVIYQSPECLLGERKYTTAVDVWSAGVVFAELLLQKHLFDARNELTVLSAIWKLLGTPANESGDQTGHNITCAMATEPTIGIKFNASIVSAEGLDLLKKMLELDPKKRITVGEALRHPFLQIEAELEVEAREMWQAKVRDALEKAAKPVSVGMPSLMTEESEEDEEYADMFVF